MTERNPLIPERTDSWRRFVYLLAARGLTTWLVNARDVKQVPGRPKTDKLDAVWLAKLNERGMLRPGELWQGIHDYDCSTTEAPVRPDSTTTAPRGPAMDEQDEEWRRKGTTLSDKRARDEFGLTQDELAEAIGAGKLHFRLNSMHGNPWLRLLRREVEGFVKTRYNERYLTERQARADLARVNRDLKRLRAQLAALEQRRSKLIADLGE